MLDFGFQAVISSRFADIFRSNALKNGLLPITVDDAVGRICSTIRIKPCASTSAITAEIEGYGEFDFPLDPFSAYCLTRGIDQLDFILENEDAIKAFEQAAKG